MVDVGRERARARVRRLTRDDGRERCAIRARKNAKRRKAKSCDWRRRRTASWTLDRRPHLKIARGSQPVRPAVAGCTSTRLAPMSARRPSKRARDDDGAPRADRSRRRARTSALFARAASTTSADGSFRRARLGASRVSVFAGKKSRAGKKSGGGGGGSGTSSGGGGGVPQPSGCAREPRAAHHGQGWSHDGPHPDQARGALQVADERRVRRRIRSWRRQGRRGGQARDGGEDRFPARQGRRVPGGARPPARAKQRGGAPPAKSQSLRRQRQTPVLIVDGYNICGCDEGAAAGLTLKDAFLSGDLETAQRRLVDELDNLAAHKGYRVLVVFDDRQSASTAGGLDQASRTNAGVWVIFSVTNDADSWIERASLAELRGDSSVDEVALRAGSGPARGRLGDGAERRAGERRREARAEEEGAEERPRRRKRG